MRSIPLIVASLALGACAANAAPRGETPPPSGPGECSADAASHLIGAKATEQVGVALMRITRARTLRWVPPRTAITMDFRYDRLTVSYDDDMIITQISCT